MTKSGRQFLERIKRAADISHALAGKMIELVELREEVRMAEKAAVRGKRNGIKRIVRAGGETFMKA